MARKHIIKEISQKQLDPTKKHDVAKGKLLAPKESTVEEKETKKVEILEVEKVVEVEDVVVETKDEQVEEKDSVDLVEEESVKRFSSRRKRKSD